VIALGLILGALEARTGKDAWRNPAPVREPGDDRIYYGHTVTSGDYLRFLAANGYTQALRNQLNPDEDNAQTAAINHERAVAAHHQPDQHETTWRTP
jgi:ParB family chromosome partitioning protein